MALVNYSLPFGSLGGPNWATISPIHSPPHATAVNSLLYGPSGHQENDLANDNNPDYFKNSPYVPQSHHVQTHSQQQQAQQTFRTRSRNDYLPPHPNPTRSTVSPKYRNTFSPHHSMPQNTRTYGEGSYTHSPQTAAVFSNVQTNSNNNEFFNRQNPNSKKNPYTNTQQQPPQKFPQTQTQKPPVSLSKTTSSASTFSKPPASATSQSSQTSFSNQPAKTNSQSGYPERPPGFTKVQAGQGKRTQVHAVLDYDDDEDYYDDNNDRRKGMNHSNRPIIKLPDPFRFEREYHLVTL